MPALRLACLSAMAVHFVEAACELNRFEELGLEELGLGGPRTWRPQGGRPPPSRGDAPVQALAVALTPRQRVVLTMPRALVQGPRAALGSVLPGP